METVANLSQYVILALFLALGLACLLQWRRAKSPAAAWSAGSFGLLGGVFLLLVALPEDDDPSGGVLWALKLGIAGLVLFPYFLYRFMAAFRPTGRRLNRYAFVFTGLLIAWTFALPEFPSEGEDRSFGFTLFVAAFLIHWSIFSVVVAYRLWRAGSGQTTLARRRMRLLAFAAVGMTAGFNLAGLDLQSVAVEVFVDVLFMLSGVLFFMALVPPAFVRASWRAREQERLRDAVIGLMRASSREEIAQNMLEPAADVVGARGSALVMRDGTVLGTHGVEEAEARAAGAEVTDAAFAAPVRIPFRSGDLLVWTSPMTPFFGPEELTLLGSLGALIGLALERADLLARERETVERLEELDEMKSTFLTAVSHELRTPLTTVLGFALTLERHTGSLGEERARELLRYLADAARKLEAMLADLLDLERLTRGVVEPRTEEVDAGALVRRTVEGMQLPEPRPLVQAESARVLLDAPKFERIVENLVYNAYRHTPPDTPVWVRLERADGGVCVVVEDAGPGVPETARKAIFEPFRREGPDEGKPGTGIGLSLVHRFAALHGGRAWVEDRPGGGASFRVFFPNGDRELTTETSSNLD